MTAAEIVEVLRPLGQESYRNVIRKHGARDPMFGVKIEHLKKIQKRVKKDYQLSLDLYDTGIYDCMYLAGLIADDEKMTKKDLQKWVDGACMPLCTSTVAGVAAEGPHGRQIALKWIESKKESVAATGWATLGFIVALKDDADLDLAELKKLIDRVKTTVHRQPNRVRYQMMSFLIAVGCYVTPLTAEVLKTAAAIGTVEVDMGDTACKVPSVAEYIDKVKKRGTLGKKRKTVKC
ncbi:MAG TPA: DNA alkylation repair protein [Gemmataceae bacterium]|nr:DNA alkylation repair protein [Gemmataceae bacterium]